jgi:hypothetical protein
MEYVQLNAIGVAIIATIEEDDVIVDVSAAITKELIFKKPCGTVVTKAATFTAEMGQIQYITVAGDLDEVGFWSVQGYVVYPGAFNGRSEVVEFRVRENL